VFKIECCCLFDCYFLSIWASVARLCADSLVEENVNECPVFLELAVQTINRERLLSAVLRLCRSAKALGANDEFLTKVDECVYWNTSVQRIDSGEIGERVAAAHRGVLAWNAEST
jgi:hypothetical protein